MKTQTTPSTGNAGKFTKGEWVKIKTPDGWAIKEKELAEKGFSDRIAEINHYPESEAEANAALIVEAKTMFQYIEQIVFYLDGGSNVDIHPGSHFHNEFKALISRINQ